jgi:hypothetical protein
VLTFLVLLTTDGERPRRRWLALAVMVGAGFGAGVALVVRAALG